MKCNHCKIDYPESVSLSPIFGASTTSEPVCEICALEIINLIHGVQRDKFQGEMAEQYRQNALEYRKSIGK